MVLNSYLHENQVIQLAKQTNSSKDMYKSEFVKLVNTVASR